MRLRSVVEVLRHAIVLSKIEVRRTGQGTRLGKFWPTLSFSIRLGIIGTILGEVIEVSTVPYLAWIASGFVIWYLLRSSISSGVNSLTSSAGLLKSMKITTHAFALKAVFTNLYFFMQNLVPVLLVLSIVGITPSLETALVIPGLLLSLLFLSGLSGILAVWNAHNKNVSQLTGTLLGLMLFVLPLLWDPKNMSESLVSLAQLNPLYHFVQIVRLPLIGMVPSGSSYIICLICAVIAFGTGMFVLSKVGRKVIYRI